MKERFAFHSFGHHEGRYQTIAALGISQVEAKPLEQFFFGQTNNDTYLAGLEEVPGIIWRTVGDRGALTRVRQGAADAHGRDTLRFETLLIAKTQFKAVIEHFAQFVLAQWDTNPDGVLISVETLQATGVIHAEKVSEVVMAVRGGKRVMHRADEFSLRDLAKIIGACGSDPAFSLCFKSLNKAAPVTVNLLSLESVEKSMSSPQVRAPKETPLRPQPAVPKRAPAQSSPWMLGAVLLALLIQTVVFWNVSRSRRGTSAADEPQNTILTYIKNSEDKIIGKDKDLTLTRISNEQGSGVEKILAVLSGHIGDLSSRLDDVDRKIESTRKANEDKFRELMSEQTAQQEKFIRTRLPEELVTTENRMKEDFKSLGKQVLAELVLTENRLKEDFKSLGKQITDMQKVLQEMKKATSD